METAAIVAATVLVAVAMYQLALALGAPWGDHAYGGRVETIEGRLPTRYRMMSAAAVPLLLLSAAIILAGAGLVSWFGQDDWVTVAVWVVFGYLVLNTVMNVASSHPVERFGLGSVTLIAAAACFVVASGSVDLVASS